MKTDRVLYKIKTAGKKAIYLHLQECKDSFRPSLDKTVNIRQYSEKILKKAITFEAWEGSVLVGLLAVYFNDTKKQAGFITNVSVVKEYKGLGVASALMGMCIRYAKQYKFKEIGLEMRKDNTTAAALYDKFGFINFKDSGNFILSKLEIKSMQSDILRFTEGER